MTLHPATPHFGALQIIGSRHEHDYVLYAAGKAGYDANGVYYMTSRIGENEAVGALSERLGDPKSDKYSVMKDFPTLIRRDVLPEDQFMPEAQNDGIVYMGADGERRSGADEFASHRAQMRKRFSNAFQAGKEFFFDHTNHTEKQAEAMREANRKGWTVVHRREARDGVRELSVTI